MSEPQYRTKSGRKARILDANFARKNFPVVAAVLKDGREEEVNHYTADLKYWATGSESEMDLVLATEWDDFKVDEPVMVRDKGFDWSRSYFKKISAEGKPCTFKSGTTSWTCKNRFYIWEECRRPTEEELGELG